MITLLRNLVFSCLSTTRMYYAFRNDKNRKSVLLAEIVRNVHSIEKGLCIKKPRLGFGIKKIETLLSCIDEYLVIDGKEERIELYMAVSALEEYLDFHQKQCFSSDSIVSLQRKLPNYRNKLSFEHKLFSDSDKLKYGGSLDVVTLSVFPDLNDVKFVELLHNRHSIRNFSQEPVDLEKLKSAIKLANMCPSACNRQTTRVYIVDKGKIGILKDWLSGIGGFVDSVNKFLIITGKMSAFNDGEIYQHIVNASIFTGFLTLSLTAHNIGNCVIMRPLLYSRKWNSFAKLNGIPNDENIVCMVAIGNYEKNFSVPVSYRLPTEYLFREL